MQGLTKLTGELPPAWGQGLTRLRRLDISGCAASVLHERGPVPQCIGAETHCMGARLRLLVPGIHTPLPLLTQ